MPATRTAPMPCRLARRAVAGVASAAAVLLATVGQAPAADEVYPSWRYPASVQTGYQIAAGGAWSARVSTSGRWVLFATVDPVDPGGYALHLRDRWNDRTTLITASVPDTRSLALSDNGRFVTYWAADGATTIRDLVNGRTLTASGSVMAINNDGYYLSRRTGATSGLIAGRVQPNGQLEAERGAARGDLAFRDVTPSLQFAVAVQNGGVARVAMTTGTVVPGPGVLAQASGDARISPNGRWIATQAADTSRLLLWDTTTGQTWTRQLNSGVENVLGVTDTGYAFYRQTRYEIEGGTPNSPVGQIRSVPFGVDIRTQAAEYRLAKDWASGQGNQLLAGDIDRIVVCTTEALIPVDTNLRTDCYLRPFPPSPLAG